MARILTSIMSSPQSLRPIVAVIGTTGVGKSQLAVSLAKSLPAPTQDAAILPSKGCIMSADSMQIYKGLDVITNKVTRKEMGGVEHWGMDVVDPGQGDSWDLRKWCGEADQKLASLPHDTLPIVCGGTHYFIQHFLFPPPELSFDREPSIVPSSESPDPLSLRWKPPGPRPPAPTHMDTGLEALLDTFWTSDACWPTNDSLPNDKFVQGEAGPSRQTRPTLSEDQQLLSLYRLLTCIDPDEAQRWHWRDGRKVRRGIERWWERGGHDLASADRDTNVATKGRRARFRTLIFWVYEPLEDLRPRLDRRVDRMLENGLLREISEMRDIALRLYGSPETVDHTEGIFQAIGYKEFAALPLHLAPSTSEPRFVAMLDQTKLRTRQYAKSQVKWIRKQLLPAASEAQKLGGQVEIFVVSGGSAGHTVAQRILHDFLKGQALPDNHTVGHKDAKDLLAVVNGQQDAEVPDTASRQLLNARRQCDICSTPNLPMTFASHEWERHCNSQTHHRNKRNAQGLGNQVKVAQLARQAEKRAEREAARRAQVAATTVVSDRV